jgi:hypothetical protein
MILSIRKDEDKNRLTALPKSFSFLSRKGFSIRRIENGRIHSGAVAEDMVPIT